MKNDETSEENQRLDDIVEWMRTEQIELCFWNGYWKGRNGIPESEAWETSAVKRIRDERRKDLVKPVSIE